MKNGSINIKVPDDHVGLQELLYVPVYNDRDHVTFQKYQRFAHRIGIEDYLPWSSDVQEFCHNRLKSRCFFICAVKKRKLSQFSFETAPFYDWDMRFRIHSGINK